MAIFEPTLKEGMAWKTWNNAAEQARGLAEAVADALREALIERGRALLVVSGGRSPVAFLEALSGAVLDWSKVAVSLADERWVPESHPDSNAGLLRRHLQDARLHRHAHCRKGDLVGLGEVLQRPHVGIVGDEIVRLRAERADDLHLVGAAARAVP